MNRAFEGAGSPHSFQFHDLRHTGNMWAAGSGANLRELMERMGHGSTRAALIYLHAASEGDRRIADCIDRKLSARRSRGCGRGMNWHASGTWPGGRLGATLRPGVPEVRWPATPAAPRRTGGAGRLSGGLPTTAAGDRTCDRT